MKTEIGCTTRRRSPPSRSHLDKQTSSLPSSCNGVSQNLPLQSFALTMARHSPPNTIHASGPFLFLNPTTRYHPVSKLPKDPSQQPPKLYHRVSQDGRRGQGQVYHVWRSRDNRKGRRRVAYLRTQPADQDKSRTDHYRSRGRKLALGVGKMAMRFPVWDVTYLVAIAFVLGLSYLLGPLLTSFPIAISPSPFRGGWACISHGKGLASFFSILGWAWITGAYVPRHSQVATC